MDKKIIPVLSLAAILTVTSAASNYYSFNNRFNIKDATPSSDMFTHSEAILNYEKNLSDLINYTYFVPQGLTFSDKYTFISFYDYSRSNSSIIKVFSHDGECINTFKLKDSSHVGGIAYDSSNNLVWVASSSGTVDAYRLIDLVYSSEGIPYYSKLFVGDGLPNYVNPFMNSVSFLTIDKDNLYVGSFSLIGKGNVKKYSITVREDKTVVLKHLNSFKVPNMVQGIAFYEKDDNTYMILSRSYGSGKDSALQIFKYYENILDYTNPNINSKTFKFPAMMEQIHVFDDQLFSLYEYESKTYGGEKKEEYILRITSMDNILK